MASKPSKKPTREDVIALAHVVGVEPTEEGASAVVPQALRLHEQALRLRELDLTDVEPAFVFRAPKRW